MKGVRMADQDLNNRGNAVQRTGQSATDTVQRSAHETGGFFQRMIEQIKDTYHASSQDAAPAASDATANLSATSDNAANQAGDTPSANSNAADDSAKSVRQGLH
jgi:hypothetical protein